MTTDSDRISRLEGIAEQTAALRSETQADIAGLRVDIGYLRSETQAGFAALRAETQAGDAALHDEMQTGFAAIRVEMQAGDAALHDEMQAGFASLRAEMLNIRSEMASNARTTQIVVLGGGATILAGIIATLISIYFA